MQIIGDFFNLVFFDPLVNLLVFVLRVLEASNIPGALGFSIIILTLVIRLLIWPVMAAQLRSAKKMADLKPHLDELKKKHGNDRQFLAQAQMALYKEHGVNPAGGCLPALIQIPILLALYQVIAALFGQGALDKINNALYFSSWHLTKVPDPNFLGINLASKPSDFAAVGVAILLVPILTALLTFIQSKMMMHTPVKKYPTDSPKEVKEKSDTEDAMAAIQTQMVYMMPLMIGFFSWQFPVGLAIYWNTFTILGIWHQYLVSGWGGLAGWIERLKFR